MMNLVSFFAGLVGGSALPGKGWPLVLAGIAIVIAIIALLLRRKKVHRKSIALGGKLKDIGELAVEEMTYRVVYCTKDARRFFGKDIPLTRDRCIFTIDVVVKMGFDFKDVLASVDDQKKQIRLTVPPMRILSSQIMEDTLEILDEKTGIFARPRLQWFSDTMAELREKAENEVIAFGAMEKAQHSAEMQLIGFVTKLYDLTQYQVEVIFEKQESNTENSQSEEKLATA